MSGYPEALRALELQIDDTELSNSVSPDLISLKNGNSQLDIRVQGAFIVNATLVQPNTGQMINVLYADPELTTPRINATHTMSPVGEIPVQARKHGIARWLRYQIHELPEKDDLPLKLQEKWEEAQKLWYGISRQVLRANLNLPHGSPPRALVAEAFELSEFYFTNHTTVYNLGPDPLDTSIGKHYYFSLPGGNVSGVQVNGAHLDERFGRGAAYDIRTGKPRFWGGFDGSATIDFPAGYSVELTAEVLGYPESKLGMLAWQRTGTPSICLEPTFGYEGGHTNDKITLAPHGGNVTLHTRVELR